MINFFPICCFFPSRVLPHCPGPLVPCQIRRGKALTVSQLSLMSAEGFSSMPFISSGGSLLFLVRHHLSPDCSGNASNRCCQGCWGCGFDKDICFAGAPSPVKVVFLMFTDEENSFRKVCSEFSLNKCIKKNQNINLHLKSSSSCICCDSLLE